MHETPRKPETTWVTWLIVLAAGLIGGVLALLLMAGHEWARQKALGH